MAWIRTVGYSPARALDGQGRRHVIAAEARLLTALVGGIAWNSGQWQEFLRIDPDHG